MIYLLEPHNWALLGFIGLCAGFIDAVVGGGGLLSIPALLTLGLPPHIALGTNKLAACFGSSIAAWTYYKKQFFTPSFWSIAFVATFLGAMLGCAVVYVISPYWLEKLLPLLIIGIALYSLVYPKALTDKPLLQTRRPQLPAAKTQAMQGLLLGGYDGFAGPGIGAFWTVTSRALYQLPLLQCCALARAMTLTSNLTALILFSTLGKVQWGIGLWLGVCMMIGAFVGARCAIKFGLPFIRPVFITVVLCMAVDLAWSAWF